MSFLKKLTELQFTLKGISQHLCEVPITFLVVQGSYLLG